MQVPMKSQVAVKMSDIAKGVPSFCYLCNCVHQYLLSIDAVTREDRYFLDIGSQLQAQLHKKVPDLFVPVHPHRLSLLKYWLNPQAVSKIPELMEILEPFESMGGEVVVYDCRDGVASYQFRAAVMQYLMGTYGDFEITIEIDHEKLKEMAAVNQVKSEE
jgi:hypothetical protein